ncbi:MAG: 3-dehydroquinate synthase family protein [Chitinophagaceae bacterium]
MSTLYYPHTSQTLLAETAKFQQVIIISDAKTNGFCLPQLKKWHPEFSLFPSIVLPDGEKNKTLATCEYVWENLIKLHANKQTLLIAVGGGALCDLVAFCASTYMRGIAVMHMPTTLLAMVDASIGGKTAIDFLNFKNIIGSFYLPHAIYINPLFLDTLPQRILKSGIAEMLKHALLKGQANWEKICSYQESDFYTIEAIQEAAHFKIQVVEQDEKDEHTRQQLNLGHTIGHAIESFSIQSPKPLLHGEAIMLGIYYELKLSELELGLDPLITNQWKEIMQRFFPTLTFVYSVQDLFPFLKRDKKNDNNIRMSLLSALGECHIQTSISIEQIATVFR